MKEYRIKPWEELTIRDDYMFKLIMSRKPICKSMLECTLGMKIQDIIYLEAEKTMTARYQGKGIRLDIYVKDEKDTVYNIEMQAGRGRAEQEDAVLPVDDGRGSSGGGSGL